MDEKDKKIIRKLWSVVLILFLANIFIWYFVFHIGGNNLLKVYFFDVGQGDSALIISPSGNKILIDGGPDRNILGHLGGGLSFFDRAIDLVIESHPDFDHSGGLPEVFSRYNVKSFLPSPASLDDPVHNEIKNKNNFILLSSEDIKALDIGGEAFIFILFPDRKVTSEIETNDSSIIFKLVYGNSSFLFTGDSPIKIEDYVSHKYGEFLSSDVLKVAHHGSKNSLDQEFLGLVKPIYSIFSAGENNSYGHPHKEVLDFLKSLGSSLEITFEEGDIKFVSDGKKVWKE